MFSRIARHSFLTAMALAVAVCVCRADEYSAVEALKNANEDIDNIYTSHDRNRYITLLGSCIVSISYKDREDRRVLFDADTMKLHSFILSPSMSSVLFIPDRGRKSIYRHSFMSDVYYAGKDERPRRILAGVRDVSFSPDEKYVAYCRDNNLFLLDLKTQKSTPVTDSGRRNEIINGTADWVYEEEYSFTKAYSFSPSGDRIAFLSFDESNVETFEMMRYDGTLYNKAYSFKYPKAGGRNSVVEIWVYDMATGRKTKVDVGDEKDQYVFNLGWTPSEDLYFYRVNRLQNHFEVLVSSRSGETKVVYDEHSPKYVERPNPSTVMFLDGKNILVREETSSGYMHLSKINIKNCKRTYLTTGKWEVAEILRADDRGVYYMSNESGCGNRDLWYVGTNGGKRHRITPRIGWNSVRMGNGDYFVNTCSTVSSLNLITVNRTDGAVVDTLACRSSDRKWPVKQLSQFVTERGDSLNIYIQLPDGFDKSKRYPVLITQYSGPGSQSVRNRFNPDWEYALLKHGYIVACCDCRGTGGRGEAFKKSTYGCLGRLETEDQISFARWLKSLPYVDGERIGIYGWSYGGFMALNCALCGEEIFRMAIAVAPVTSWRFYDSIYTEIYNGLPQDNGSGYDDYSPLSHASRLFDTTSLLIVHGTADDNVHFQNSMEMCRRLNGCGKRYDMMVYPDQNHSMLPSCRHNVREKLIQYTLGHL